jgi:hypothetical protein
MKVFKGEKDMPISDLDTILNKDAIIATYPASHLRSNSEQIEQMYRTHAKTHIPLGNTSKYLDTIFKWVGGQNKGAFIGAVVGDYGHGKTSFQVHIWEESTERKVFAVPPFSWKKVTDMIEGTAAWVEYMLSGTHPEQARQAQKLYDNYREKNLKETAEKVAKETGQGIEEVVKSFSALNDQGAILGLEITSDRFLDYCEDLTIVIKKAGYSGLLMLLDEPEVAAKELGFAAVSQILFDIANGLLQRQGDYGVFISMPENFLARAQSSFASLPARLQGRSCLSRLRDIYGSDFAEQLWSSYVNTFGLSKMGSQIVKKQTLKAIGQVSSSERKDLSYGPRTVVSAFRQMIYNYKERKIPYEVVDFVEDCLDDEILVSPDYSTKIKESLSRPESERLDKNSLKILAGFPNGITIDQAEEIGVQLEFLSKAKSTGLVYKIHNLYGLVNLRRVEGVLDEKEPDQTIEDIFSEFAPAPKNFEVAKNAFIKHVIPVIFEKKVGQQLIGWDGAAKWIKRGNSIFSEVIGAFKQTANEYPKRKIAILVGPYGDFIEPHVFRDNESQTDIVVHYLLRWNIEENLPKDFIDIILGKPEAGEPTVLRVVIDLLSDPIPIEQLENIVDSRYLTPFGILYLIGSMDRQSFPKDIEAIWAAMRKQIIRKLPVGFFQNEAIRSQASEKINRPIPSGAVELIPSLCLFIMKNRFPEYSTLIRQPQWLNKIKDYVIALQNMNIPLACKRGREPWKASKTEIANAFNTNIMNLGDFFNGYESLIHIVMGRREDGAILEFKLHPLEEKIMERIVNEKPKKPLKIDDKECWWIDIREIFPDLLYSGYQQDEISQIFEIGKARGTFSTTQHKGSSVLYCKPLDSDQMKAQLREKLESLQEEFKELEKLPDFRHTFSFAEIRLKIESVEDEADYESIKSKLHRAFEQNHDRLDTYFNKLEGSFADEKSKAIRIEQSISSNRQISLLKSLPTGTSKWCSDLSTYIMTNLNRSIEELKIDCRTIKQNTVSKTAEYCAKRTGNPLEKIKRLIDGWDAQTRVEEKLKQITATYNQIIKYLEDYEQWVKLLNTSDALYKKLIEMKKDDAHKVQANGFIQEVETIWEEISELLKTRNIAGLGSYNQYFKQFEEIELKRKKYLHELRSAFDKLKDKINQFLIEEIGLGSDNRTNIVFNPENSKGCYDQLFHQASEQIIKVCEDELNELYEKKIEILYISNVLKRISDNEIINILIDFDKYGKDLKNLTENVGVDLIEKISSDDSEFINPSPKKIKEVLEKSRELSRSVRKIIHEKTVIEDTAKISKDAENMLKLIPENQIINLKDVILQILKKDKSTESILDPALQNLSELFRNGKVQIKIELPRKR